MSSRREACRTCLREDNLTPIFARAEQTEKYTVALFLTTGLQIELNDGLPQSICCDCRELVSASLHFREQGHESEQILLRRGFVRHTVNKRHDEIIKQFYENIDCEFSTIGERKDVILENLKIEHTDDTKVQVVAVEFESQTGAAKPDIKNEIVAKTENERQSMSFSDDDRNDFDDVAASDIAIDGLSKRVSNELSWSDDSFEFSKKRPIANNRKKYRRHSKNGSRIDNIKAGLEKTYGHLIDKPVCSPGPYTCQACQKITNTWRYFKIHARKHLGKVTKKTERRKQDVMCEFCGRIFSATSRLSEHCMTHHGKKRPHQCIHCDYTAVDTTRLMNHVRLVHTKERPYVCDTCGAKFAHRPGIVRHMSAHSTVRTRQCPHCPSMFKSKNDVTIHITHMHMPKVKTECTVCHKYRRNIREHMLNCHDIRLPGGRGGKKTSKKKDRAKADLYAGQYRSQAGETLEYGYQN